MAVAEFIKRAWPKLIEETGNPMAPIILQEAYNANKRLGQMLASTANKQLVTDYSNLFLQWMQDAESEEQAARPEFVIALAGMLVESIVAYTTKTVGD